MKYNIRLRLYFRKQGIVINILIKYYKYYILLFKIKLFVRKNSLTGVVKHKSVPDKSISSYQRGWFQGRDNTLTK